MIEENETLIAGMLKAIDSVSEELFRAGLSSYQTETNQRVTLLKHNAYILAIFGDKNSLQSIPEAIRAYIFQEQIEINNLDGLSNRLQWIFWPPTSDRSLHQRGLIITVGRTLAPIWFALSRHTPEIVGLIASEQTKSVALEVSKYFGFELELNAKLLLCDENDTTSITKAGLNSLDFLLHNGLSQDEIAVNATGGTKGMTIAIAHISYAYNISVYYVESPSAQQQKIDMVYGDEEIAYLDNPSESVGVFWENIAVEAFNTHNFLKAWEYFEEILNL